MKDRFYLEKPRGSAREAQSLYDCIDRNRDHLKNLVWSQSATLLSTTNYLRHMMHTTGEQFLLIKDRERAQVIGVITLRVGPKGYELGYWLDHAYRGRGIITDMVARVIRYNPYRSISARIRAVNKSSRRVLEKNGFIPCIDEHDPEWITYNLNVV